jgi:hypothetical protein
MSLSVTITDDATPFVLKLREGIRPNRSMHGYIGRAAREPVQRNFQALAGSEHNAFGARSSGFWQRMLAGTDAVATDEAAVVRMPREVAQRYFGGTIVPTGGRKFLAIPARTEAYNKSPRQFDDLVFVVLPNGGPCLIQKADTHRALTKGKNKGKLVKADTATATHGEGGVMFWLRRSVTQRGNEAVLPPEEVFLESAMTGLQRYMEAKGLS